MQSVQLYIILCFNNMLFKNIVICITNIKSNANEYIINEYKSLLILEIPFKQSGDVITL